MNVFLAAGAAFLCGFVSLGFVSEPAHTQTVPSSIQVLIDTPDDGSILTQNGTGGVILDGEHLPILEVGFDVIFDDDGNESFAVFGVLEMKGDEPSKVVVIPVDVDNEQPDGRVMLVDFETHESLSADTSEVFVFGDEEDSSFGLSGELRSGDDERSVAFELAISIGAGSSTFRVEEQVAYLNGDLGSRTYDQVEYLIIHHPDVKKIIFEQVPGSINDEVNVLTGRLIRDAGFITELREDSMIASGGVDLFLAGTQRIVAQGAMIGVHSWAGGDDDQSPADLPEDHPAHRMLIEYTEYVLPGKGRAFYFYTINAAPAEDIHWMSEEEISEWGIATE